MNKYERIGWAAATVWLGALLCYQIQLANNNRAKSIELCIEALKSNERVVEWHKQQIERNNNSLLKFYKEQSEMYQELYRRTK